LQAHRGAFPDSPLSEKQTRRDSSRCPEVSGLVQNDKISRPCVKRYIANAGATRGGFQTRPYSLPTLTLLFRDYLQRHPETVREYERLKHGLMLRFPLNVSAYGSGKGPFIEIVIAKARVELSQ